MRQHFFLLWFPGLLDLQIRGKLFLKFFTEPRPEFHESILMVLPWRAELLRRLGESPRTRPPSLCYGAASRSSPLQQFVAIGVIRVAVFRNGNNAVSISFTKLGQVAVCVNLSESGRACR
jgi:hypothetical protein